MIARTVPPWVKHPRDKRLWVPAKYAAREYFRKSHEHILRQCKHGDFAGVFETYHDGFRWWIKLPEPMPKSSLKKHEKTVIRLSQALAAD